MEMRYDQAINKINMSREKIEETKRKFRGCVMASINEIPKIKSNKIFEIGDDNMDYNYNNELEFINDENVLIIRVDEKRYKSSLIKSFIAGILIGILLAISALFFMNIDITKQAKKLVDDINNENSALSAEISSLNKKVNDITYEKNELKKLVDIKDQEIQKNMDELNSFRNRKELYDKYSYVISINNIRTGINYSTIALGEKLMKERGINPHMLFGLIRLESAGNPKTTNSKSTARGLGQFLKGTGKWVYEDLLGNGKGSYNHDMAFDQNINIRMCVAYLDYLMRTQNGDARLALRLYNGNELGDKYIDIINSHISPKGVTVSMITNQYRSRS